MKNTHILPNTEVPIELRKEVYREALRIIEIGKPRYSIDSFGLCLLLPCVLWELRHVLENAPNGKDWDFYHTENMFPELKDFLIKGKKYTNQERINFLKSVI